ncbi:NAD(P)/FAD-dependent oxidoreductase [Acinetobacter larvae]|uniref:FAD-dependent oxidoreductase n=1 Tax=Acinetobacter larvae TaxID=1789224 RepID=A0A1B2LXP9_9GAMM|nr:FAD-dependent oxidoreductase [Acinetobacter larvae]AOA57705.1 FAD-dependent oxidoreductase [Acinetobacter larvae]
MKPIIIIGSGMAGYTLAREFRKLNKEQPLVMISADDAASYAKPTLSNALAGQKHPDQIALANAEKMSQQLNMQILQHAWVEAIHATTHQIQVLHNGQQQQLEYDKLILAVGADPIRLNIAGDRGNDLYAVNCLDEYRAFREKLAQSNHKRVLILGAGLIGCEFANDLQHTDHQVTVVDLAPQVLARLLPTHVADQFQHDLEQIGIKFILGTTVQSIEQEQQHYRVNLANQQHCEADIILSAIGLQPRLALAKQAQLNTSRGIITNQQLATNQADIFAIGDCAEVNGMLLPYVMPLMQQARALAKTLNGEETAVHYPAMPIAVKTPAAPLTLLPIADNIIVEWQTEHFEDGLLSTATDADGRLRGFVLLGATAAKQRLSLSKQVPDLLPLPLHLQPSAG